MLFHQQLKDGEKAAVNQPIALLAEEGDDISNVEMPAEESSSAPEQPKGKQIFGDKIMLGKRLIRLSPNHNS